MHHSISEFLENSRKALRECKRIHRRVERLSRQCEKLVHKNGLATPGKKLIRLWKLLEEEREREIKAVRYETKCYREVKKFIDALPDPTLQTSLRRLYLGGEEVAVNGE